MKFSVILSAALAVGQVANCYEGIRVAPRQNAVERRQAGKKTESLKPKVEAPEEKKPKFNSPNEEKKPKAEAPEEKKPKVDPSTEEKKPVAGAPKTPTSPKTPAAPAAEPEEEEAEEPEKAPTGVDDPEFDSDELLGNLVTLPDNKLTKTAKEIKAILQGGDAEQNDVYKNVPRLFTKACHQDTCCVWKYLADEMESLFRGKSGRCTKWARFAVRAGFHDSGAWEKTMTWGGADGSLALFEKERKADENKGLSDFIFRVRYWYAKYHDWYQFEEVTHADIIQVAASVAVTVCPLGPRMRTYVGRPDGRRPNPTNLLPSPFAEAGDLIALFERKTIRPHGLTALIGAHTTSAQRFTSPPQKRGFPQDSTPGVWDTLFYQQTLLTKSPRKVFRFPSDEKLAVHPKTADEFKEFADPQDGQDHWNEDYAREYVRLSLLGVKDFNKLTDCSKIVPAKTNSFRARDQDVYDRWLNSPTSTKDREVCDALDNGDYAPIKASELKVDPNPIMYSDIKNSKSRDYATRLDDYKNSN